MFLINTLNTMENVPIVDQSTLKVAWTSVCGYNPVTNLEDVINK
jgi:hypothetical protein